MFFSKIEKFNREFLCEKNEKCYTKIRILLNCNKTRRISLQGQTLNYI